MPEYFLDKRLKNKQLSAHLHLAFSGNHVARKRSKIGVHLLLVSPQWFSPLIDDVQVSAVNEEPVPLATSGLFEDAEVDHVAQ